MQLFKPNVNPKSCRHLPESNIASVVTSICTLIICWPSHFFSKKFKAKLKGFPIPGELIVLILGIAVVYAWPESDEHVIQIGKIPNGIAKPKVPRMF